MHDPTKVLLGVTGSSDKAVTRFDADPVTFKPGIAVRESSTGGLVIAANGTAVLIGISLGESQSDTKKTAVARTGDMVPIRVTDIRATCTLGDLTFNAVAFGVAGNGITVTLADETTDGTAVIATDPDSPTDIIVNMQDGVTIAQDIADAIAEDFNGAAKLITVVIADGEEESAQDADDNTLGDGDDVLELGKAVTVDNTTGLAASSGTATSAVYISGLLRGQTYQGDEFPAAYVTMPGGL